MAPQKYLKMNSGTLTEQAATDSSAGAGDAGKIPALDSTGRIDTSMMPAGLAADTASIVASENLAAGDFVNVHVSSGTKVRKADASTTGKQADGFVLAAVTAPAAATVYFEGRNTQVSGQTAGKVYLSPTTPGAATATPPSTAGQIVQRLGTAVSATEINFEPFPEVVLA